MFTAVKLEIYIPEQYVESLREALHAAGAGRVGKYDHCLSVSSVRGYWRPLEGAIPYEGRVGELAEGTECKVEVRCERRYVADALAAIRRVHPYDEPVVNIIALVNHLSGGDPLELSSPSWYRSLCAGQDIVRLDLKNGAGRAALDGLLERADLLLTSSRPAALERRGLAWSALRGRFPRLAQVAIVGHASPRDDAPGHDLTYLASSGLLDPPDLPRTLLADLAGAERAVSAACALLYARERGGRNRYSQVSLADAAVPFAGPWRHGLTEPRGLLGGGFAGYNLYETKDGWLAVAALEPQFWARLKDELGLTEGTRDEAARVFSTATAAFWEAWGAERDLPLAALRT